VLAPMYEQARELSFPERKAVCEKAPVKFTMTRDPYDRLTSCYLDKVVFQEKWPAKANDLLPPHASFEQFIDVLVNLPIEEHDAHTMPFSYRCNLQKYHYDLVGHLETFDDSMTQLFQRANLGLYTPSHEKDAAPKTLWESVNNTLAEFSLPPEVLYMHGAERVAYFYNEAIQAKVANSWWAEDVQMFSADLAQREAAAASSTSTGTATTSTHHVAGGGCQIWCKEQLEQYPEKAAENCNTVHCAECDFCAGETTDGSDVALGKHNEKKLKHKGEGANGNSVPAFHDMTHRSEPYSAAAAFDWNFEMDER